MKTAVSRSKQVVAAIAFSAIASQAMAEAGPAGAQPAGAGKAQQTISYADLNLASETGRDTLARRIESAARQVCGSTSFRSAGGVRQATVSRRCVDEAVAEALTAVSANAGTLARAD
ncbi:UrcA family protein [Pseudohaliea sp.]|uniref:UrcA family protein n=1 Tax=Pseudohaliea sp. TaxID=2740289 RepID=UPI0032EB46EE